MSAGQLPVAAPSGTWPMFRAMVGVGLACGLIIVSAYLGTKPRIEHNRAEALAAAIYDVLPGAVSSATFRWQEGAGFAPLTAESGGDARVHAGYDAEGRLVGVAIEAAGMGYQDVIHVLWGYSITEEAIVGLKVLESRETPGLGDRIEHDPALLENFRRLDVSLTDDGQALRHDVAAVKHGTKTNPWEIDSITGATISSKAIGSLLDASASVWAPRIQSGHESLEVKP